MLLLEALETRSLPSLFLPVDGLPNSATGWAPTPGTGATVRVSFRGLPGPAVTATRAAVAALDHQFQRADVGVRLVVVPARAEADVLVGFGGQGGREGGTTFFPVAFGAGRFPNGRPYFRWAGRIQIAMDFATPWYYGAAAAPGGGVDFETAVMHELGHSIGLDHNPDPADAMNAILPPGAARRHFDRQDLLTLRQVYGRACPGPLPSSAGC
jgi:hypothetical protein